MRALIFCCKVFTVALGLFLISHQLQSDGNLIDCNVEVECIGRIPYYVPLELVNPVLGCSPRSIWSVWGDSRDLGKRRHEGMDIFAPKGTPVIAPVDGIITRTGWNILGGKVIWLQSRKTQHNYYFAHLSGFEVCVGDKVVQGEIIGRVGTSGNARFTKPHLHFGIYAMNRRLAMNREIVWIPS